jgi:4-amino-4-deoxy-L-arabinose transferase-like glycosyltransferase
MPFSSKPFEEPQKPSQAQDAKDIPALPELISIAAPPEDMDSDVGESRMPLPPQDEGDIPALPELVSIAAPPEDPGPNVREPQKPLPAQDEKDIPALPELISITAPPEDPGPDVGESQKPLPSQNEKDIPALPELMLIAASPENLDPDVGEPQEPLVSTYENDASPTVLSLVALPKDLDPHGNFGIQQRYSNFFLLGSSSHSQVATVQWGVKTSLGEGIRAEGMQVVVTALDILDRSETPLKTHARPAFSGENNRRQYSPEPRTSTAVLLATGLKTVETPLVHAYIPGWLRVVIILLGLVATFAFHAINMFYYPRYETDEGTYMMSAWAITHGSVTPYPYGYGHPPLAWIQIAAWLKLTGGFATFGNAINSGRVLMLLLAVGSAWLVYRITYHLRLSFMACLLAMLVFALSPLSITFQREVLLDNFATFWFLLALYLIITGKSRLSYTISSAICFGIALLSKEIMIILFPVMIYVVWLYTARFQRTFTLVCFVYGVVAVGSAFVLMAVLKGELFPYEWHLPWDAHQHLSLIGTYLSQAGRGQGEGSIQHSWISWVGGDPLLIILGIVTPVFNLVSGWWNRKRLFLALFAIIFWGLLLRGGVVFPFYIIPLIPLIALNTGIALETIERWSVRVLRFKVMVGILALVALAALIPYDIHQSISPYNIFILHPTVVQSEALDWIHAHVSPRAVVVVNSTLFTDLHEPQGEGVGNGATYPYAHEYLSVATDPELHDRFLQKNWDRVDYIVANAEMLQVIQNYGGGMNLIKTALTHAVLRVELKSDNEFMRIYEVIHLNPPVNV